MREHRGWIALDIDGTITDASHRVPPEVAAYVKELYEHGWEIIFITGRAFAFAHVALQVFTFPFYLAVQNGADIVHMPSRRLVARNYFSSSIISETEKAHLGIPEDFILYTGFEHGDFCYYRPKKFSNVMLARLHALMPFSLEPWKEVDQFTFDTTDQFPLIKCLGIQPEMERLHERLEGLPSVVSTLIRDPSDKHHFLNLITHQEATKGKALKRAMAEANLGGYVIAAGDDLNDVSMLNVADCKIVMENAPLHMHSMAHILAEPGHKHGIVNALKKAVRLCA